MSEEAYTKIKLPSELKSKLEELAQAQNKSLTSLIVELLEKSLEQGEVEAIPAELDQYKIIWVKYQAKCDKCGSLVLEGEKAAYNKQLKKILCLKCYGDLALKAFEGESEAEKHLTQICPRCVFAKGKYWCVGREGQAKELKSLLFCRVCQRIAGASVKPMPVEVEDQVLKLVKEQVRDQVKEMERNVERLSAALEGEPWRKCENFIDFDEERGVLLCRVGEQYFELSKDKCPCQNFKPREGHDRG